MNAKSWKPLCYYTITDTCLHLVQTHIPAASRPHAVIMDEEQLTKEGRSIYPCGQFYSHCQFNGSVGKENKISNYLKKGFYSNNSFIVKDRNV